VDDADLHPVEAGFARLRRGARPVGHVALDVLCIHRLRDLAVGRRLHGGGPEQHARVVGRVRDALHAEVVELRDDPGAVLVHRRGDPPVRGDRLAQEALGVAEVARVARGVDEPVARHEQPGAASSPRHLVVQVARAVDAPRAEELRVGGLQHAVADVHDADAQRAEQGRELAGGHDAQDLTGARTRRAA
jgi:hypothetical protein